MFTLSVHLNQGMQRIVLVHPANQSAAITQRSDTVSSHKELLLAGLCVSHQQAVYHGEELHHTLVLAEIFISFEKELVAVVVTSDDGDFTRVLLALQNGKNSMELLNANLQVNNQHRAIYKDI